MNVEYISPEMSANDVLNGMVMHENEILLLNECSECSNGCEIQM